MMNATIENAGRHDRSADATRSTAELERDSEEIRADLDRTLDEIERKLSPGELLDRSVDFLREHGSGLLEKANETVRRNPVPLLLTAASLVWLTTSIAKSRSDAARGSSDAEEVAERTREAAKEVTRKATGRVANSVHAMKDRSKDMLHAAQNRTQEASSSFLNLVREQPVPIGALALAAGALAGAAFPITPYENRLIGPVHDRTLARAKEVGQREYEKLRQAVSSPAKEGGESGADGAADSSPAPG